MATEDDSERVFLSYARADGQQFVMRLNADLQEHGVATWRDGDDIALGHSFYREIDRALITVRAVLVVVTPGAGLSTQVESEWNTALNRFTPVIPLLVAGAIPRALNTYERIDFRTDYSESFNRLLKRLQTLNQDHLRYLSEGLEALRRAQHAAPDPSGFDEKIAAMEEAVAGFETRVRRQRDRVTAGFTPARADVVAEPSRPETAVRVVGTRPIATTDSFRGRSQQLDELAGLLGNSRVRMVTVLGRGGIGKTALALQALDRLARSAIPPAGIALLSSRTAGLNLEQIFVAASTLLDSPDGETLMGVWGRQGLDIATKIGRLLDTLSRHRSIVLLDNLDEALDQNGRPSDPELEAFLEASLTHPSSPSLLVTSRIALALPAKLAHFDRHIVLREGLGDEDAVTLLRELDANGDYGLQRGPEQTLHRLARTLHGVPRALELAVALLQDPFLSPGDIADRFYDFDEVVEQLVEANYGRLDIEARRVVEGAAVFRRPVRVESLDYLLEPFVAGVDVSLVVRRLVRTHLLSVDRETKLVSLHPVDCDFLYSHLDRPGGPGRVNMERRAAAWYHTLRGSRDTLNTLERFEPELLEFEHTMRAGDHDAATEVLARFDSALTWDNHAHRIKELLDQLEGSVSSERARLLFFIARADNRSLFGHFGEARLDLQAAERLAREQDNRLALAKILFVRAGTERALGDNERAVQCYEDALQRLRDVGEPEAERYCIFNLGLLHAGVGDLQRLQFFTSEMESYAKRQHDSLAEALTVNLHTIALLARHEWHAALASAIGLFPVYRHLSRENWFPAVHNMAGLALIGLGRGDEARDHLSRGFVTAREVRPQYASHCAFNLAWAWYRDGLTQEAIAVVREGSRMSAELQPITALDALGRAIEAAQAKDAVREVGALLECARTVSTDVDLVDALDVVRIARRHATDAGDDGLLLEVEDVDTQLRKGLVP